MGGFLPDARGASRRPLLPAPHAAAGREAEPAAAADHVVVLGRTVLDDLVDRGVDPAKRAVAPNSRDDSLLGRAVSSRYARRLLDLPTDGSWVRTVA